MLTAVLARGRTRAEHKPTVEPNVIPFIDVLLVLLIIFMVTAPKPTIDLHLEVPNRATRVMPAIPPTVVEVQDDASGYRLIVNQRDVGLEALASTVLAHVLAVDPVLTEEDAFADARIYVRADQDVAYANVVAVIDELQHAGFAKVGVFAEAADET